MAETDTKVDIPKENPEANNTIKPEKEKASAEPEKHSKKDKKSKKEKKSKKNRSRSRSESESTDESKSKDRSSGSRSKSRSHRRKHSKKHRKHRKRSESESRSRSSSHRRKSRREHRHDSRRRDHRDRREHDDRRDRDNDRDRNKDHGRDRERDRHDRRSRTRSPHPLLKGKVQEVPVRSKIGMSFSSFLSKTKLLKYEEDANKSKMFWDGFQWVAKANTVAATADPALLTQTKKMRRLNISNLPLNLGLGEREIGEFVTKFIIENYLNDEGNYQPVREVTIDSSRNSAIVELSSVEEASKLAKVETIKILGHNCLVSKEGSKFGATTNLATLVTEAQRTAQAQAAVLAAMSMLQNKDTSTSFTLSKVNVLATASKILKVANLIDVDQVRDNLNQELNEVLEDIKGEFGNFGSIKEAFIVKPEKTAQGAEAGTVFIVFESETQAEKALNSMANKRYDGRELRIIYVDEETYNKNFAGLKTA